VADARIKFIVELIDKFSGKSKKITSELEKTEKAAEGADKELSGLEKAFVAAGTAAATYLVVNSVKAVIALNDLRLESDRADRALMAFTGGSEEAAAALDAVVTAGDGAISKLTAAQNAARLFSMGLAETSDEAGKLTEMAITLGAAMGKGPQDAFEEFTLLLANQSIQRLDTFGISAGQVRERIKELQQETEGLSRTQAFNIAVMEQGQVSLDALAESGFEAATETDRLKASWEDLKLAYSDSADIEDTIGFLDELISKQAEGVEAANALSVAVDAGAISFVQSRKMLQELSRGTITYAELIEEVALLEAQATENNVGGHRRRRQSLEDSLSIQETYNMSLREEIDLLGGVNANLTDNIEKMQEQIEWIEAGGLELQRQAEETWNNYLDGVTTATEAQKELNAIATEAMMKMGEFDLLSFDEVADSIRKDLGVNLWEARRLATDILGTLNEIDGLKASATVTITTSGSAAAAAAGGTTGGGFGGLSTPGLQQAGRTMIMPPTATNDTGLVRAGAGEQVQVTSKSSTFAAALREGLGREMEAETMGKVIAKELINSGVFG
jgi:hypothetical protein